MLLSWHLSLVAWLKASGQQKAFFSSLHSSQDPTHSEKSFDWMSYLTPGVTLTLYLISVHTTWYWGTFLNLLECVILSSPTGVLHSAEWEDATVSFAECFFRVRHHSEHLSGNSLIPFKQSPFDRWEKKSETEVKWLAKVILELRNWQKLSFNYSK